MKKHNSPLRYPGGKSILSGFFLDLIDENNMAGCTYVEPYAGGAGSALSLLYLEKVDNILINDLDKAIYSFWKSIVTYSGQFIEKIEEVELNIEEWRKQKEIYQSKTSDAFALGFSAFYLNRTNHSGILNGGPIGGLEQKGNWKIDARFNKDSLIQKIRKISLYKNRIKVSNKDGIKLLRSLKKDKNTLIYLDPPYFDKGSSLYLNHYKPLNHEQLRDELNRANSKWVLTYDHVPEISELYKTRQNYLFTLNYSADKPKVGKEVLVLSETLRFPSEYL
ncbi:MAG: DNA adenine methylase [Burkholderiales bacterium]|nr:DNA adenine methylase [Burkholderiales bacterium]